MEDTMRKAAVVRSVQPFCFSNVIGANGAQWPHQGFASITSFALSCLARFGMFESKHASRRPNTNKTWPATWVAGHADANLGAGGDAVVLGSVGEGVIDRCAGPNPLDDGVAGDGSDPEVAGLIDGDVQRPGQLSAEGVTISRR
jgi:hypothetical protein